MTTTTTIEVPTSCAALCAKRAELAQHIDDQLAQAAGSAALDHGSDAEPPVGELETAPTRIGAVTSDSAMRSKY